MNLEIRNTHNYVDTYKHLDAWTSIGTCRVIGATECEIEIDEEDICDPRLVANIVRVTSDADDQQVKHALRDKFTSEGCGHEYDCCGCRSYRVSKLTKIEDGMWLVLVHSSRNF